MQKRSVATLSLLFLVLSCLLPGSSGIAAESRIPRGIITLDGRTAPPLALNDLDGKSYRLAEKPGEWVLVHFWASWCGPCRREMPTLQKMKTSLGQEKMPMSLVLINTSETEDTVFSFLGIVAPELPTLLDPDGQATARWQPRGLPATFFVDPEGKLRYLALGGREWDSAPFMGFLRHLAPPRKP